jgi:hypothetical protein
VGTPTDTIVGEITAIASNGTNLFVGGYFGKVGSLSANHIASWNGSAWSALGGGTSDFVASMAFIGNDLYVTGQFRNYNGTNANSIARWRGTNWFNLGSGLNAAGTALAASGTDLYVAGNFTKAGLNSAYYFSIWHRPKPVASNSVTSNGNRMITWTSEPGEDYQVLSTTDLSMAFLPISGIITATGYTTSFLDSAPAGQVRYYEILEVP